MLPGTALHAPQSVLAQFMGIVHEVGPNVKSVKKGDRVVACFDIACALGLAVLSTCTELQARDENRLTALGCIACHALHARLTAAVRGTGMAAKVSSLRAKPINFST